MIFKPFDIDSAIARNNAEQHTQYRPEQFAFLQALTPECLNAIRCANELLSRSADFGLMADHDTGLRDRIREQIINNNFKAVRSSMNDIKMQLDKKALHDWHVEQQRRLTNPDLWQQLMAHPSAKLFGTPLGKLQNQWLNSAHSQYAAHTSNAILFITQQIIPLVESYHHFAKLELTYSHFRLPKILRLDYKQHLTQEEEQIANLKQDLCDTMLARFEMASQSGILSYDDSILHTTEWLARQQLIKQQHGLPQQKYYGIDHKNFDEFVKFIRFNGNDEQQHRLQRLPCFQNDENFKIHFYNGGALIIPAHFAENLIPKRPVFFEKIFPQQHARFQFMQKNLWLLANLRVLSQFNTPKHNLNISINHLLKLERLLEQGQQELATKTLTGWQKIFTPSATQFKLLWQNYYTVAQRQLLDKKLELLEQLHSQVRSGISLELEKENIETLLASINPESGLNTLSHERIERYFLIKKRLTKQFRSPQPEPEMQELEPAADNNPFAVSKSVDPPAMKLVEPEEPKIQYTDIKLLDFFNNIQLFKLDQANFQEALGSLFTISRTIAESEGDGNKQRLLSLFAKIFDQYLRHCSSFKVPDELLAEQSKLNRVEELLLAHAPGYIQERINALREIKTKTDWFIVYTIKCRSYLASCLQQTAPYLISNASMFNLKSPAPQAQIPAMIPQPIGAQ